MSSANNQNETNIRAGGGSVSNKKGLKCDSCGSTEIDVDPSRADAVCTHCGNVLESSIIVSDIQVIYNQCATCIIVKKEINFHYIDGTLNLNSNIHPS